MKLSLVIPFLILLSAAACTDSTPTDKAAPSPTTSTAPAGKDLGVGPVKSVVLESTIKAELADKGKTLFEGKCSACHKIEERYVGPALKGVTQRREPEWIMNMIMNPQEMTQKNETAKGLLGEFLVQMTFQNLTEEETRAILEYFRKLDQK